MGSDFSKQLCCVTCGRCGSREEEEANESSETKPILRSSEEPSVCMDPQPSTPALEVCNQGLEVVQSLSQDMWPSADAVEEKVENCSAVDPKGMIKGWEATSMDCLVAPATGESNGEVKVLTQRDNQQENEKVGNTEEEIKPVVHSSEPQALAHTGEDEELVADKELSEQPEAGGEDDPCAEVTPQNRNMINFIEVTSETPDGLDAAITPPAETGEGLMGRDLPLCAVQVAEETETWLSAELVEETDGAKLAEMGPLATERAELTVLVDPTPLLSVQAMWEASETVGTVEVVASDEMHAASAVPWMSLYPEEEFLEAASQLLDFLLQETQSNVPGAQENKSLHCTEPAELSKVLCQPSDEDKVFGELEDEESRECNAETAASEAEPQHKMMQQTGLSEPLIDVQISVKQEAEFLNVAPSLADVFETSGEREAENVGAQET